MKLAPILVRRLRFFSNLIYIGDIYIVYKNGCRWSAGRSFGPTFFPPPPCWFWGPNEFSLSFIEGFTPICDVLTHLVSMFIQQN